MSMFLHSDLADLINNNKIIEWCKSKGLLPTNKRCEICNDECKSIALKDKAPHWRCQKKGKNKHQFVKTMTTNTLFENSKLGISKLLLLAFWFAYGDTSYEFLIRNTSSKDKTIGSDTISKYLKLFREICTFNLNKTYEDQGLIGGEGEIVEIDETKIGHRKNHKGRIIDGQWVVGLIQLRFGEKTRGGKFRIELCDKNKRDNETLIKIITKHVKPGTTIMTDLWKGYSKLEDYGYIHLKVNHSENFVDPITWANTQTIESQWRALKDAICSGGMRKENLKSLIDEFLWCRDMKQQNNDLFLSFVNVIVQFYISKI